MRASDTEQHTHTHSSHFCLLAVGAKPGAKSTAAPSSAAAAPSSRAAAAAGVTGTGNRSAANAAGGVTANRSAANAAAAAAASNAEQQRAGGRVLRTFTALGQGLYQRWVQVHQREQQQRQQRFRPLRQGQQQLQSQHHQSQQQLQSQQPQEQQQQQQQAGTNAEGPPSKRPRLHRHSAPHTAGAAAPSQPNAAPAQATTTTAPHAQQTAETAATGSLGAAASAQLAATGQLGATATTGGEEKDEREARGGDLAGARRKRRRVGDKAEAATSAGLGAGGSAQGVGSASRGEGEDTAAAGLQALGVPAVTTAVETQATRPAVETQATQPAAQQPAAGNEAGDVPLDRLDAVFSAFDALNELYALKDGGEQGGAAGVLDMGRSTEQTGLAAGLAAQAESAVSTLEAVGVLEGVVRGGGGAVGAVPAAANTTPAAAVNARGVAANAAAGASNAAGTNSGAGMPIDSSTPVAAEGAAAEVELVERRALSLSSSQLGLLHSREVRRWLSSERNA